jgi:hypothetical protein
MPSRILRLWNPDLAAWEEVGDSRLSVHLAAGDPHPQYLTAAEGSGAYLPLTGGTLTGLLTLQGATATTNVLQAKLVADTQPRFRADASGKLEWGPGGATAPSRALALAGGNGLAVTGGHLSGAADNATSLGLITARWSDVIGVGFSAWHDTSGFFRVGTTAYATTGAVRLRNAAAVAWRNAGNTADLPLTVDASNQLTFNGVPIGAGGAYLPLAGGELTGDLLVSEATPTVSLKQAADTQPRSRLTDTALAFGPGGTTAPDATLARTGAGALRADTNLGVGVNPAGWGSGFRGLQVGPTGALWASTGGANTQLSDNTYHNGTSQVALAAQPAVKAALASGGLEVATAPAVGAGAAQTFTPRLSLANTGTLTLLPAAGQSPLVGSGRAPFALAEGLFANTNPRLTATSGSLELDASTGVLAPARDNAVSNGYSALRWTTVYAVAGTINTSSREFKEGITPLDPALALEAVRATPAVTFTYTAPERPPEWYDLPDDPEQAQQVLEQRLRAAPLEQAAREQAGFIAEDAHPLFLVGEGQTAASNSVGVLLAALQALDTRVSALEGA